MGKGGEGVRREGGLGPSLSTRRAPDNPGASPVERHESDPTTLTAARCAQTLLALFAALCISVVRAEPASEQDIEVRVELTGPVVHIDTSFHVEATPQEAWAVMIDYDRATEFISDLDASRVLARDGDTMRIYQKGTAKFGPFSFPVESVRDIRLVPFESMQSHLVNGSMKRLDVTTRLAPEGSGTRITNHTESIPDVWIPPIVGRLFIAHETREKFRELRDEILRRKQAAAGR
jgi:hypothetical protein